MIIHQERASMHSSALNEPITRKRTIKNRKVKKHVKRSVLQSAVARDAGHAVSIDLEFLQRFMTNNAAAGEQLHAMCATRLYRTAFSVLRNRQDAEDAVQDCWVRACANLKSFRGRSSFLTWLTRIVINSALMILRQKRNEREISAHDVDERLQDSLSAQLFDRSQNPEETYAQQERRKLLNAAISNLRPRLRAAVQTGQLQERSLKQTARELGISPTAVKTRIFHARVALRRSPVLNAIVRRKNQLAA